MTSILPTYLRLQNDVHVHQKHHHPGGMRSREGLEANAMQESNFVESPLSAQYRTASRRKRQETGKFFRMYSLTFLCA